MGHFCDSALLRRGPISEVAFFGGPAYTISRARVRECASEDSRLLVSDVEVGLHLFII